MTRRSPSSLEAEARDALLSTLEALGVEARQRCARADTESHQDGHQFQPYAGGASTGSDRPDFTVEVGGVILAAEVKSVVTEGEADQLARRLRRRSPPTIVVADRIAEKAKSALRHAGVNFFDRRGELRLVIPPLIIDARVPESVFGAAGSSDVFSSQVAKEVAIACLLTPDQPHGVREVASHIDRVPSAVSNSMARLRDAGLLTSKGEPAIPDLFQELSVRWRRQPVALADLPRPGRGRMNAQLQLGMDEVGSTLGWALTDTLAAAAWGMPVVARGDYPPDFYVPSAAVSRRARALLGDASKRGQRACTVAVPPVRLACLRRHKVEGEVWPLANHIVVALDIASDRARTSDVLEQWHPDGIVRAW